MSPEEHATVERRRRRRFDDLFAPARVLLFLLIVVALLQIYNDATFLVSRTLGILLLFLFGAIVAMLLTPLVDRLETMGPLRGRRGGAVLVLNAATLLVTA